MNPVHSKKRKVEIQCLPVEVTKSEVLRLKVSNKTTMKSIKARLMRRFTGGTQDCEHSREAVQDLFKQFSEQEMENNLWYKACPKEGCFSVFIIKQCGD